MIKVEDIYYRYKESEYPILNGLSFSIKDGEMIAIIGKNGSGKSTIGKLIAGIIPFKKGKILIDDVDISKNFKAIQDKVGIVFQNPENQIIFNNIYDELSFSLKHIKKEEVEKRVNEVLEQVEMIPFKNQDLYTLSLGQKQRIMIAEVLARHPKYIILDEPTTMIDSLGKEKIYEIIKNLKKQGYTIMCITNVADEILLADRTLILHEGKIIQEIKKKDLIKKAHLLEENGMKIPTILKILTKLKDVGVDMKMKDYSVDELINQLKRMI